MSERSKERPGRVGLDQGRARGPLESSTLACGPSLILVLLWLEQQNQAQQLQLDKIPRANFNLNTMTCCSQTHSTLCTGEIQTGATR